MKNVRVKWLRTTPTAKRAAGCYKRGLGLLGRFTEKLSLIHEMANCSKEQDAKPRALPRSRGRVAGSPKGCACTDKCSGARWRLVVIEAHRLLIYGYLSAVAQSLR